MTARPLRTTEHGALWALDLRGPAPRSMTSCCAAVFREARAGDATTLAALMGLPGPEQFDMRLENGRRCFVATLEEAGQERIAVYGWVSGGQEYVGELERAFQMPKNEVYIWDCLTLPEYRGKHLYSALLSYVLVTLRAEGVPRAWVGASMVNRPSVRGIENAGFRPVLTLVYRRLFMMHYMWIAPAPGVPARTMAAARRLVITGREWRLGRLVVGVG